MTFWFYVAITAILDAAAILLARTYTDKKDKLFFVLSLACFAASGYFYIKMLAFAVTAIVNIIFVGFSVILVTGFCYIFFKEKITLGQALGVILIFIGVSLL